MAFEIKGNYFEGNFHLPSKTGPEAAEREIEKTCPSDLGLSLWECPIDYRHIDQVLESAMKGMETWRRTSIEDRKNYFKRFQEQILSIKSELSNAISLELGKPRWEADLEVENIISSIDICLDHHLPRIESRPFKEVLPKTDGQINYRPIGPCLIISPFDFPCHNTPGNLLNALIAGNSIILKPSEKSVYCAQLLFECFHKAQFPLGVINLIHGKEEMARRLLKEKRIKGVFFTGSVENGRKVLESTYKDFSKLVSLSLGGKNPCFVHKDCHQEFTLQELLKGCFLSAGQRCNSTSLIFIHEDIHKEFIKKFHTLAKNLIVDNPLDYDEDPFMGPLIDQKSIDNYLLFMGMAKREGIQEIMRGKSLNREKKGHYVSPSIHLALKFNRKSLFLTSEILGPNCTFIPYSTISEAISWANMLDFGLVASVFSADKSIYQECLKDLDIGQINFNKNTLFNTPMLPFGGIKNSGNYRPGSLSGIDHCVYQQSTFENSKSYKDIVLKEIIGLKK